MAKKRAKRVTAAAAMKALHTAGAPSQEFGKLNADGSYEIDPDLLEKFKKQMGKSTWGRVRFVALNAPFKRRSPISPG
jgi:hypothetical protein